MTLAIPAGTPAGRYELKLTAKLSNGTVQTDTLTVNVVEAGPAARLAAKTALYDPAGETEKLLSGLGVKFEKVDAQAKLDGYDILVIGKKALTAYATGPDVLRVRDGLKVLVFEQTKEALEKRLGFRVQEYGLRRVFPRIAGHPALAGLDAETLSNWRGAGTTVGARIDMPYLGPRMWMMEDWAGFNNPRVWRAGCYGSVASLLIEKPACGDFLPLVDGGFSLEFSPLMEYREGKGLVLFCQLDVTGRTETDPAAERLVKNVLNYLSSWKPLERRKALYAGDPAGKFHLESTGLSVADYAGGALLPDQVLIVGPGGAPALAAQAAQIRKFLESGGMLLLLGQAEDEANGLLPFKVTMQKAEHIANDIPAGGQGESFSGSGAGGRVYPGRPGDTLGHGWRADFGRRHPGASAAGRRGLLPGGALAV